MFRCREESCGNTWWEWFEHLTQSELIGFARSLECPECGSQDWELTDASSFAGSQAHGDAGYPKALAGINTMTELRSVLGIEQLEERITELEDDQ